MNNLAATRLFQGDLAGARMLQEEALATLRGMLGAEHPAISCSAWHLYLTIERQGDHAAAQAVLSRDLQWLLDRDPGTLSTDQRRIQTYILERKTIPWFVHLARRLYQCVRKEILCTAEVPTGFNRWVPFSKR
jgi:hypothetical protein